MSASPIARQVTSHTQAIPSKRVMITDATQLPDLYSSTPGGTLFSTTPGGTRIVYERAFLMNLRQSPISQTPPLNLPSGLLRGSNLPPSPPRNMQPMTLKAPQAPVHDDGLEQFEMDM